MPCCCLATRSDCVLAISIYGVSISVALLSVLGLHGHDFGPGFSIVTTEILHKSALSVYAVCLVANIILFIGLVLPHTEKLLLVPWLISHTLLVVTLMAASLYYLGINIITFYSRWLFLVQFIISVLYTSLLCLDDCTVLLGYSISIIVAIITLLYCIYVVQDYFDALQHIQVTMIIFISLLKHQDIYVLQKLKKKAKQIAAKAPQVTSL